MFLKKPTRLRHTLAFRLTLWHAGIFTLTSCVAFLMFYMLIVSVIRQRVDTDLLSQVNQFSTLLSVKGVDAVKRVAVLEAQAAGVKKIFIRLLYRNGEIFSSSNMTYWQDIDVNRRALEQVLSRGSPVFDTMVIAKRKSEIRVCYGMIGPGILLQLGQSMEEYTRFIEAFKKIFIAAMSLLVVLAALAGWFIARRAVSGIEAVTRTARQIADGALEKRVPSLPGQDEINRLATAFNEMIDRIQALVSGIREMNDHIAHDLKSPVTRIRGLAEVTLTTDRSLSGFETMAASTVEECDRLLDMINTMLVISETEAGVQRLQPEALDMAAVVREACELFEPFAEDKNVGLSCIAPDRAVIQGEIGKIQRMVSNLIDNAVKYTPSGGSVALTLAEETDHVRLEVSDTGIGISETDLPHVFERFYRCDRSRSEPGSGLGLSLVKAIVLFHGGEIAVDSAPGRGTHIRILLPKNPTRKTALNRNTFDKNPNPR